MEFILHFPILRGLPFHMFKEQFLSQFLLLAFFFFFFFFFLVDVGLFSVIWKSQQIILNLGHLMLCGALPARTFLSSDTHTTLNSDIHKNPCVLGSFCFSLLRSDIYTAPILAYVEHVFPPDIAFPSTGSVKNVTIISFHRSHCPGSMRFPDLCNLNA